MRVGDTPSALDRESRPDSNLRLRTRVRLQIARRHHLAVEVAIMVVLYVLYDSGRGFTVGGYATAYRHARDIAHLEQSLHVFIEPHLQSALTGIPGMTTLFGIGYDYFHIGVTSVVLLWLFFFHPSVFPRIRTLLLSASLIALVGFTFYPAAPPRLADVGLKDTLHIGRTTAETGYLHWLYNPYAAIPSLHMAYAVVAGGSLFLVSRRPWVRALGVVYPLFIAAEVMATGNHFLFDVVTGIVLVFVAIFVAVPLAGRGETRRIGYTFSLIGRRFRPRSWLEDRSNPTG